MDATTALQGASATPTHVRSGAPDTSWIVVAALSCAAFVVVSLLLWGRCSAPSNQSKQDVAVAARSRGRRKPPLHLRTLSEFAVKALSGSPSGHKWSRVAADENDSIVGSTVVVAETMSEVSAHLPASTVGRGAFAHGYESDDGDSVI